jgi:hypothetical protein
LEEEQMKSTKAKQTLATTAMIIVAVLMLQGCSGGGSSKSASKAVANATITGKVSITGTDDCSGVAVVAERVESGVTRTVANMLAGAKSGKKVAKALAADAEGIYTTETNGECEFSLKVPANTYSVYALKNDTVESQPKRVTAGASASVTVDFELVATGSVGGTAVLGANHGSDVVVVYLDGTSFAAYADNDGEYTISNVPVGDYTVIFSRAGVKYGPTPSVTVTAGETASVTTVSFLCVINTDCDDSNASTADVCTDPATVSSDCTYSNIECASAADPVCDDSNPDTEDTCVNPSTAEAYCQNALLVPGGAEISADTTWTKTMSPITITGQIHITEGVALTIDPGVTVQFKYPASYVDGFASPYLAGIMVDGELYAEGTEAEPITFTLTPGSADTFGAGFWGGIYFTEYSSGGSLQHVNMEYPSYAIQIGSTYNPPTISDVKITHAGYPEGSWGQSADRINGAALRKPFTSGGSIFGGVITADNVQNDFTITNVSVSFEKGTSGEFNGIVLVNLSYGATELDNITVSNAPDNAVYIYYSSNITINGMTVSNTTYNNGIYISESNTIDCTDCSVADSMYGYNTYIDWTDNVTFTNCTNNNGSSGGLWIGYMTGSLTNCDMSFNQGPGLYAGNSIITIDNSRISDNCGYGVSVSGYANDPMFTVDITDSNITNNTDYGVYGGDSYALVSLTGIYLAGNNGEVTGTPDMSTAMYNSDSTIPQYNDVDSVTSPQSDLLPGPPTVAGTSPTCGGYLP